MSQLNLSVAIGDYDRNRPLIDGAVRIDGVDPVFMKLVPEEIFFRAFRTPGFRHLRTVAVELHAENRARPMSLCRRSRLRVALFPPYLDFRAHRPDQETRRSEGQESRRAGIAAHRQCLGARDSGRRFRREAFRHALGARRHRPCGAAGEDRGQSAAGRQLEDAPEGTTISELLLKGEIDGFIAPRAPALSPRPISAGCFPIPWRRGRIISSAPEFSRSCI